MVAKCFTALDLFSSYYEILLAESDQHKNAFIVPASQRFPGGLFQFNIICLGLTNAPATFCGLIVWLFGNIEQYVCLLYIEAFFVSSKTFEEQLCHLVIALHRLEDANLKVKPFQCSFAYEKIFFLGHQVSAEGIPR